MVQTRNLEVAFQKGCSFDKAGILRIKDNSVAQQGFSFKIDHAARNGGDGLGVGASTENDEAKGD